MSAYDRARLAELFGNDPTTIAEIEREFYETARDVASEIAATDDCPAIARSAHRLKGAAGMIGATALHELSKSIELAAKAQDLAQVRTLHDRFHNEIAKVAKQAGLQAE